MLNGVYSELNQMHDSDTSSLVKMTKQTYYSFNLAIKPLIVNIYSYRDYYVYYWNRDYVINLRVNAVRFFKCWQSAGSTAKSLITAAETNILPSLLAGVSTEYAIISSVAAGYVNWYSKGRGIMYRMTGKKTVESSVSVYEESRMIYGMYFGVWGATLLSSLCAFLAAFLTSMTLFDLIVIPLLTYLLPLALLSLFTFYIPIGISLFTAFSAWYSFIDYNLDTAKKFALTKGEHLYKFIWERDKFYRNWALQIDKLCLVVLLSLPLLVVQLIKGFFFMYKALSLIASILGGTYLTLNVITNLSLFFIIPSLITTIATKIDHLYEYLSGQEDCLLIRAIGNYFKQSVLGWEVPDDQSVSLPSEMNFVYFIVVLSLSSALDLFNTGLGAWALGSDVSTHLFGYDLSMDTGVVGIIFSGVFYVLCLGQVIQTYAYEISSMLNHAINDTNIDHSQAQMYRIQDENTFNVDIK